jgi:hypothetical protein
MRKIKFDIEFSIYPWIYISIILGSIIWQNGLDDWYDVFSCFFVILIFCLTRALIHCRITLTSQYLNFDYIFDKRASFKLKDIKTIFVEPYDHFCIEMKDGTIIKQDVPGRLVDENLFEEELKLHGIKVMVKNV